MMDKIRLDAEALALQTNALFAEVERLSDSPDPKVAIAAAETYLHAQLAEVVGLLKLRQDSIEVEGYDDEGLEKMHEFLTLLLFDLAAVEEEE